MLFTMMAGKYFKAELIGSGTFGKAWLVKREDSNRKHVLKEIQVRGMSEKHKKQSLTEVEVLAKCKHLNVVRYREAFVEKGFLNIIMEYAENGDLQTKIDAQKGIYFESQVILDWFVQICFGLRYIHGLNILHRDLKTQNIFLNHDNIIKIGDFGISRILTSPSDCANTTIGTPYYLSPEICQKKPYNNKSDMWALGCVLYNIIALHQPFEAPDLSLLMVKILNAKYEKIPSHYLPLLNDLCAVLLKVEADNRPSASEILCIPAVQPYVNVYIKRSLDIRERKQYTPSPAVKKFTEQRLIKERSVSQSDIRKFESPDDNKENIDPRGSRSSDQRPLWGTPKSSSILREVNSNIQSPSSTRKKIKATLDVGSPRMSLHREVLQKAKSQDDIRHSSSDKLCSQTYTVSSQVEASVKELKEKQRESLQREICKCMYDTTITTYDTMDIDRKLQNLQTFLKNKMGADNFEKVSSELKYSLSLVAGFQEAIAAYGKDTLKYLPLVLHCIQIEKLNSCLTSMKNE